MVSIHRVFNKAPGCTQRLAVYGPTRKYKTSRLYKKKATKCFIEHNPKCYPAKNTKFQQVKLKVHIIKRHGNTKMSIMSDFWPIKSDLWYIAPYGNHISYSILLLSCSISRNKSWCMTDQLVCNHIYLMNKAHRSNISTWCTWEYPWVSQGFRPVQSCHATNPNQLDQLWRVCIQCLTPHILSNGHAWCFRNRLHLSAAGSSVSVLMPSQKTLHLGGRSSFSADALLHPTSKDQIFLRVSVMVSHFVNLYCSRPEYIVSLREQH